MMAWANQRWADLPLRDKALVAISLPLVILLLSLVLIYITERQTARAEEDVRRVLLVQGDIQAVHTLLAEAAGSVRGYLLTRRADFLPAYQRARPLIEQALARLDRNVRDPEMRQRLQRLDPLIRSKLDGLGQLSQRSREDTEQITAILIENKQVLDALREQISEMRSREDTLLAERSEAATHVRMRMLLATLLAAGLGLFGAIVAVLLLSRGIVARVQRVQRNAEHLALGQALRPQSPDKDEIGQLGTRLVEAGQLLAERERALRDNEERLRLIIDGVKDYGIFALDPQGYVTSWNFGAERIKGYREAEIIGRHFSLFYLPEDCPQHPQRALSEATLHGHYSEESWRRRKDGSHFWASVVITAQHDASGTLRGFSKITRDITERRAAEIALGTAREEAESASRAKSEFLSRMSHELRTPLNSILGFAQLLDMEMPPAQHQQVGHILRAGRHLLALINEVLDIARIESGHLSLSLEPVPLRVVLQEALALVSPMAGEADIRLVGPDALSDRHGVVADRQRLIQVLLNLLSNAIKYNRPGGQVRIDVSVDQQRARIAVSDTGLGIAPELLGRLFQPFERLNADDRVEGTGLGLALSKSLLELMDGQLDVSSTPGQGSCFSFELPFSRLNSSSSALASSLEVAPATPGPLLQTHVQVLCIEDNLASLALIETLLQRRPGVQLIPCLQGQLGLDLALQHRPRVILLDVNLPDMPGIEVLRRLRRQASTAQCAVLMISADANAATHRELYAAGASAILAKPLDLPAFFALLDQHLPEPA